MGSVNELEENTKSEPVPPDAIIESLSEGVFTIDRQWRLTSFNRAAERITGYSADEVLGRTCREVFRADVCDTDCPLRKTLTTGRSVVSERVRAVDRHGRFIWVSVATGTLKNSDGAVMGGVQSFRDMTDRLQLGIDDVDTPDITDIVAVDPRMHRIVDVLPQLAASDATILISGPTGAGKDLIARVVHSLSQAHCFVRVGCSALPEHLLERELFGRDTGSTDEVHGAMGKLHSGTVLLDDVDALPVRLQRRVVEIWKTLKTSVHDEPCKGRLMATTRVDLKQRVRDGSFSRELYTMLAELRVDVPPLQGHPADIPLLVAGFLKEARPDRPGLRVSPEVMTLLRNYDYEENVRELRAIVEYAAAVATGDEILPKDLPGHLSDQAFSSAEQSGMGPLQSAEAEVIRKTLARFRGNRTEAAKALGMHRTTLWRKIRQYEIADVG